MEFTLVYRSKIVINSIKPYISKKTKVLDIGCGNCVVTNEIKKNLECSIMGTDILDYSLKKIPFKKMKSPTKLSFKKKSFDVGLFIDVLHHIPSENQINLVKEGLRVCNKIIIFEVKPTFISKALDYLANKIHNPNMALPFTHRTHDEWIALFLKNKITVSTYKVKSPILYPINNYLFLLKNE